MSAGAEDIYLWERVSSENDAEAFGKLYRRYIAVLYAAVSKHIENKADIEEVVQETFMELWENRHKINIQHSFFSYLFSMARYKTWKQLKTSSSWMKHLENWASFVEAGETASVAVLKSSAEGFMKVEQKLERTIASLPEQMQLLFKLKFEDRLSNEEIAERMKLSRHTIRKHLTSLGNTIKRTVVQFLFTW